MVPHTRIAIKPKKRRIILKFRRNHENGKKQRKNGHKSIKHEVIGQFSDNTF